MMYSIIVATPDEQFRQLIGTRKQSLIPKGSLQHGNFLRKGATFDIRSFRFIASNRISELSEYIKSTMLGSDGIILLIDEIYNDVIEAVKESMFTVPISGHRDGKKNSPPRRFDGHLSQKWVNFANLRDIIVDLGSVSSVPLVRSDPYFFH